MRTALLEVRDVYAGYGETEILHGVSADIDKGEIVTVIGPNGAGKSTLLKAVIGILKPSKGGVQFRGMSIAGWNPEELVMDGLAYVPQNRNIFPTLTVLENFEIGAITRRPGWLHKAGEVAAGNRVAMAVAGGVGTVGRLLRRRKGGPAPMSVADRARAREFAQREMSHTEFEERVEHIVGIFPNLQTKLRTKAGSLSGGEQQMVAIGKALVLDPVLLLIDEPSAGLAPKLVSLIFEKILEINRQGTAILLVEQNARRALSMSHRGYVLEMGRNRYSGSGEALLRDPDVGRLYLGG